MSAAVGANGLQAFFTVAYVHVLHNRQSKLFYFSVTLLNGNRFILMWKIYACFVCAGRVSCMKW